MYPDYLQLTLSYKNVFNADIQLYSFINVQSLGLKFITCCFSFKVPQVIKNGECIYPEKSFGFSKYGELKSFLQFIKLEKQF